MDDNKKYLLILIEKQEELITMFQNHKIETLAESVAQATKITKVVHQGNRQFYKDYQGLLSHIFKKTEVIDGTLSKFPTKIPRPIQFTITKGSASEIIKVLVAVVVFALIYKFTTNQYFSTHEIAFKDVYEKSNTVLKGQLDEALQASKELSIWEKYKLLK